MVYLYVFPVLELRFILSLLVLQTVLLGFNEVLVVATVTVQPLGLQVDDVRDHGVKEISVVRHYKNRGLPRLQREGNVRQKP